jgi:hypothetical protein
MVCQVVESSSRRDVERKHSKKRPTLTLQLQDLLQEHSASVPKVEPERVTLFLSDLVDFPSSVVFPQPEEQAYKFSQPTTKLSLFDALGLSDQASTVSNSPVESPEVSATAPLTSADNPFEDPNVNALLNGLILALIAQL